MVMNAEIPITGKTAAFQKTETRVKLVRRMRRKRRDMTKKKQVSNKNHTHHHHHHHGGDENNYGGDEEENDGDEEENDEKEEVEKKVMALKRIVPGGESLVGIEKLFEETASYIMELQCQVQAMKVLATFFEGLEKENMKLGG